MFNLFTSLTINKSKMSAETSSRPLSSPKSQEVGSSSLVTSSPKLSLPAEDIDPLEITLLEEWQDLNFNGDQPPDDVDGIISSFDNHLIRWFEDQKDTGARAAEPDSLEDIQVVRINLSTPLHLEEDDTPRLQTDTPSNLGGDGSLNFGRGTPSRIELNSPVKLELDTPLRIELDSPRVEVDNQSRIRRDTPWVRDRVNRPQNDEPVTPLRTKPDTSFYQTPATTLNQVSDTPFIQKPTTPFNQTPIGVVNRSTPGGVLNTLRNVGRLFSRTPQTGEGEVERSHTDEIQKREVVIAPETGLTSFPEFWSGEEDGDEELVPDSLDHSQVTIDVNPVNGFDCAGTRHKNVSTLTYYKDLDLSERSTAFKGGNQRNKSVSPFSPAKKTSGNQISGSRNDADDYSVSVTVRSQVGDESFSSSFFQSELPNIVTMQRGDHAADVRQELWLSEDRLYTRDINRSYCWNGQHGGPPIDTSTPAREVSELHVLLRNGSRQTWHYDGGCYTEWRSSARMEGTQSGLAEVLDLNDPVHQPFGRGTGEAHDIPRKGGLAAEKGSRAWNDWLHWSEIENEVGRCPEEESSAVWFSTRVEEEDEDTEPSDEWIHITLSDIEEECYPLDEDRSLPSDHCSSYSENEYYSAVDISIRSLDIVQSTPGESPGKSFSGGLRKLIRSVAFDDGFFGTSSRNASGRHEEITQQQARHIDMERVQESPKTSRLLDILRKRRGREVKGAPTSEKNVRGNQFDEVIEPAMEVDLSGYDNISAGEGLSYSDISQDSLECSGMQQGRYQRLRFSDDSDTSAANSNNSYGSCEVTGSEGACERTQKYNGDGSSVQSEGWRDCDRLEQPSSPSKVLDPTCKSSDSRRVPNKSKVSWFRRALSFAYPKTSNHKKTEKFDGENCDTGLDVHPCRPELLDNSGETLCAWSTTGRKTEEQLDVSPKSEEDLLSSIRSSKWERDNRGVEWGNEQHVCLIAVNGRPERKPACGGEAVEVNGQCFKPCHESWLEGRIASISDRLRGQRGNQRYKLNLVNFMNQIASKAEKSRKGGEDVYLSFSEAELSQYSAGIDGGIDQDWLASETPFLGLAIRGYVMSDADIARESNDAEGYLIIDGDGDAAPDREDQVQEDFSFSVQKVGDDDGSPKRQAVNMDEIADLLNEGVEDQEPDQPDSNGLDHDGEVIVEDGIAEVKVEGVEAGVSIQWPGGDAGEGTEGVVETEDAPNTEDDGQEREETQKQEEPVLIEVNGAGEIAEDSLVDVEPVAEEKPVVQDEPEEEQQESEEDRPEIDDTPVVIDQAPEIIVDTSEDIEDQEVDDTPVVVEVDDTPVVVDTPEVDDDDDTPPEEPEIDDTPVIIDAPEPVEIEVNGNDINGEVVVEDLSPSSGNVAVDVTLGQEREEEERREVPAEDTTAKVVPVSRPKSSSSSLSDRIRAFERKQQENEPISRDRGQSHRLDSSKFLKYKSTDEPSEDEAPKPKTTGSKRLDMSRFALFQNQPGDAADGPPKKNFTIKPANKSPRSGSQGVSSTDQSNKCLNCEKRVYPMDKISADGKPFHKWCFRCAECKKTLTLGNYAALNSVLYCKPHFTQLFKLHGNYNTGFNQGMRTSPQSSSDGHFEFDIDRQGAMEEIAATEAQTTESTPVTLEQEGLVRSSDTVEEQMAVSGGTKSILEQFKKGNVSNVETKRTIDTENVQVKSLENYQPPPKDDDEPDTHVKPQDMIDTDRDQGQTAESEPQHREGVVQGGYTEEVTRSSEGLKNLKSMWEKGGVSNIQAIKKEKIEVRSLEDVQESTSHAVAENVPAERRSDVLAGDVQEEDPGISSGLAQRIKAQFEQGKVSNIEKPKPDLERTPGSLEDYSQGDVSQSVSESTPQRRDDVIRSDIPLEEQASAAEGTRSLLSRWEKGEVEHAEVRPGEGVEDPKTLKGEYATSDPQVRDDLARESDPVDDEIPKGLARNISQTIEGSGSPTDAEFNVEVGVSESLESEPKRLPEEDDQDEAPQFEVNVEVNGNVSPTENGHGDESTPNGHYENEDEGALLDSSTEIKAVRAAAEDEQDQSSILVESR